MTDSKYFLVRLDDLPPFRRAGIMHAIALHPGVDWVSDADYAGLPEGWREHVVGEPAAATPKRRRKNGGAAE